MTDETKTPLETFLELLEVKKEAAEASKGVWETYAYEQLKAWGEKAFDMAGEELPTPPVAANLTIQVSPPEVVNAEGWWNVKPNLFDMPPQIILNNMGDPDAGIDLSVSRSNGAFLVQNQEETAQYWLANSSEVAEKYGISVRVVEMAAHNMAGLRYLLPTQNWGGTNGYNDFAIQPAVPFNGEEDRLWWQNWKELHFMPGVNFVTKPYYQNPGEQGAEIRVDKAGKHRIFLTPGHPQWVVPALMANFNSSLFKSKAVSVARSLAHRIDAGQAAPVAGYAKVKITGKDTTKWYAANGEATHKAKQPTFSPGREV